MPNQAYNLRRLGTGLALTLLFALASAIPASAKDVRFPIGLFGTVNQPTFVNPAGASVPEGLAFDQGAQELYVPSGGDELQTVDVSATAGQFRLKFNGETTADIAFDAPAGEDPASVQAALEALPSIGLSGVSVGGSPTHLLVGFGER